MTARRSSYNPLLLLTKKELPTTKIPLSRQTQTPCVLLLPPRAPLSLSLSLSLSFGFHPSPDAHHQVSPYTPIKQSLVRPYLCLSSNITHTTPPLPSGALEAAGVGADCPQRRFGVGRRWEVKQPLQCLARAWCSRQGSMGLQDAGARMQGAKATPSTLRCERHDE